MGLREILGLPDLPGPIDPSGAPLWAQAQDRLEKFRKAKNLNLLPMEATQALGWGEFLAGQTAKTSFKDAAEILNKSVTDAINALLAAVELNNEFQAAKTETERLVIALFSGPDDVIAKIYGISIARITTEAATNLESANKSMGELLATLKKKETDKANLNAEGFVKGVLEDTRRKAGVALAVETETPEIKVAQDRLTKRLALVEKFAASGRHSDALSSIFEVAGLCTEIDGHKGEVAEAKKLRDQVVTDRAAIDAKVKLARLVFSTDSTDEGIVRAFTYTDQQFEGAMLSKDYKTAKVLLKQLSAQADAANAIKNKSDAVMDLTKAKAAAWEKVNALVAKTLNVPRVTPELVSLYAVLPGLYVAFQQAINGSSAPALRSQLLAYEKAAQAFLDKANDSAAEIEAHKDTQVKIDGKIKARYLALFNVEAVLPSFASERAVAQGIANAMQNDLLTKDYVQALQRSEDLLAQINKVEALGKANAAALSDQVQLNAKYAANKIKLLAPFDYAAFTDSFFKQTEAYRAVHAKVSEMIRTGDKAGHTALDALIVEADELARLNVENNKARAQAESTAQTVHAQILLKCQAAVTLLEKFQPQQAAILNELTSKQQFLNAVFQADHFMKAMEVGGELDVLISHIHSKEEDWLLEVLAKQNEAADKKRAALLALAPLKAMQPVTPLIHTLKTQCEDLETLLGTLEASTAWGQLLYQSDNLLNKCTQLAAQKATHDSLLADHQWIIAQTPAIKTETLKFLNTPCSTPAIIEIRNRLQHQFEAAQEFDKRREIPQAKARWEIVQVILAERRSKEAENLAGFTPDAHQVYQRWNALQPTIAICNLIYPITPELKKARQSFDKAFQRFLKAFYAAEWEYALDFLPSIESEAQALAALKGVYDAAEGAANQRKSDAKIDIERLGKSGALAGQSTKQKLALLDGLRGTGKPLTPEEKGLQRDVYAQLAYEPEFKAKDEERRKELVSKLLEDKEIREARSGWEAKTNEQRLAIVTKAIKVECDIYDIPTPAIILYSKPPGLAGFFDSKTGAISINTFPGCSWDNYAAAIDLAMHENAHNYQAALVARLENGLLDKDGEEFVQASLFATNSEAYGYMTFAELETLGTREEAEKLYNHQPLEKHAFETGQEVARAIMEPKNVKLGVILDVFGNLEEKGDDK